MLSRYLTLILLLLSKIGSSQTDFYKYNQSTGTSEKIGYTVPSNSTSYFAPYRNINLELYSKVLAEKQKQYDANSDVITQILDDIFDIIISIGYRNKTISNQLAGQFNIILDDLEYKSYDWADSRTFNQVKRYLLNFKTEVEKY